MIGVSARECFLKAYRQVTNDVEAPRAAIETLLPGLLASFEGGQLRRDVVKSIASVLPLGSWRWPEFERQFGVGNEAMAAELLHHRIWTLAYAYRHESQFAATVDSAPYKMFSAIMDDRSPATCRTLNGTVKHHADPFWKLNPVPCARLDCRCSWIALSRRDLEKLRKLP